jgi:hypothetical protein
MLWPKVNKSERGTLCAIQSDGLPFVPQRIFYVTDVPKGFRRGNHAHWTTQQVLICIQGEIIVELDHGNRCLEVSLLPNESVFVDKLVWDSQVYKTGHDILMSICSTEHNPEDYITDYDFFKDFRKREEMKS